MIFIWDRRKKDSPFKLGESFEEYKDRTMEEPKKYPCSDCVSSENEVFDVDGLDFCGDCLAQRVKAFNAMMSDVNGYLVNWRYKK